MTFDRPYPQDAPNNESFTNHKNNEIRLDKNQLFSNPKVKEAQHIVNHSKLTLIPLRKILPLLISMIFCDYLLILIVMKFLSKNIFQFAFAYFLLIALAVIFAVFYFHISQIKYKLALIFLLEKNIGIKLIDNISDINKTMIINDLFSIMMSKQKKRFDKTLNSFMAQYK